MNMTINCEAEDCVYNKDSICSLDFLDMDNSGSCLSYELEQIEDDESGESNENS